MLRRYRPDSTQVNPSQPTPSTGNTVLPPNIPSTQRPIPGNPVQPESTQVSPSRHTPSTDSTPSTSQDYANREDLELLQKAVTNLASFFVDNEDEEPSQDSEEPSQQRRQQRRAQSFTLLHNSRNVIEDEPLLR